MYFTLKSYWVFSCHKFSISSSFVVAFLAHKLQSRYHGLPFFCVCWYYR